MNPIIKSTLALGFVVAAAVLTSTAEAEIHSRSKELVVMEGRDLPEQAQAPGNSLFLHSDNAGSTYLYVEQQQGVLSATMLNSCIFVTVRRKPCSIYGRPRGRCFG